MIIRVLVSTLLIVSFFSCRQAPEQKNVQPPGRKELADLNRYLVRKDRERIEGYIERRDLKMTESQTGLWFQIKSEGSGELLSDNQKILMEYTCSLLDGTRCYSSEESGPEELIIGRSEMVPGLDQGLKMLKPGGEAVFIIPPFLAYGLKGDGKKIPARSVIVYEVKILNNGNN